MKRILAVLLSAVLLLGLFAGTVSAADTVLQEATAVQESEVITEWQDQVVKQAQFTYNGEPYYLNASPSGYVGPWVASESVESFYETLTVDAVFSTKGRDENGNVDPEFTVTGDAEKALRAAFETLTVEVLPIKVNVVETPQGIMGVAAPVTWPEITSQTGTWAAPVTMKMGFAQMRCWVIRVTGNLKTGGEPLVAQSLLHWFPSTPAEFYFDSMDELDAWLEKPVYPGPFEEPVPSDASCRLILTAGTYEGQIVIPEELNQMSFEIAGETNQAGECLTTLKGGISREDGTGFSVWNLNLVGAGSNKKTWDDGADNYGIVDGNFFNCTFEDFHYAVYCSPNGSMLNTGKNSTFINNRVAICYDNNTATGGNPQMWDNTFKDNKVAIHFMDLSKNVATTFFEILRCKFIDNQKDVRNQLRRNIYMPGNFFGETDNGQVVPCLPRAQENGSGSGVVTRAAHTDDLLDSSNDAPTYAYPRYDSTACTDFIYAEQAPVVSVANTASFTVPAASLTDMTITVMDAEDELAQLAFPAPVMRLMALRMRTIPQGFDATVEVERSADGKTITFTMNDPMGKTPIAKIPVDSSWLEAAVTYDGTQLDAENVTIEDGYVCFPANNGGTYTITAAMSTAATGDTVTVTVNKTPAADETVTVDCPEDWAGKTVYVYAPDGAESTVAVGEDGKAVLSVAASGTYTLRKDQIFRPTGGTHTPVTPGATAKPVVKPVSPVFADVHGVDHWAMASVDYVTSNGLFNGIGGGLFDPDGTMTRAMLMTVLARLDGQSTEGGANWYDKGMSWAVTNGVSDGSDPNGAITREQLVTMLYRYAGKPAAAGSLAGFADAASVSVWAENAMQWAVQNKLIQGMDGKLAPMATATRAQVATILCRYSELVK